LKKFILLFYLLLLYNCRGNPICLTISNQDLDNNDFLKLIENKSLFIENSNGLENIYYLAKVDSIKKLIGVAYFLDWDNEFPDFGQNYESNFLEIIYQMIIPIFYTNWLYIPSSGGLQRILFGKHDVEGIWGVYNIEEEGILSLRSLYFETKGHKQVHYSFDDSVNNIGLVSRNNHPYLRVITWNHMLDKPINNEYMEYTPIYFPSNKWKEYNMNNQRAEMAKNFLKNFNK
tara:strand:+ start:1841 stop:2533 length:693 start_codon:yes stop_codon:yes gene_type:complete